LISVFRNFNPGPMSSYEKQARNRLIDTNNSVKEPVDSTIHNGAWLGAVVPILVLALAVPVVSYCIGTDSIWPLTLRKFATAYQVAESQVPIILIASGILASIVAAVWLVLPMLGANQARPEVLSIFFLGMGNLLRPLAILIAAWMLGTAISNLGAATFLSSQLSGHVAIIYMPAIIFLVGACISFSTGTSWGTMAVLMPLSIPLIFAMTGELSNVERDPFIFAAIGAVFSGAVFGDHCSPFSDTTIIASIAAGVEPLEHFRTQLPFAALTGLVAVLAGFLPLGYGVSPPVCLLSGLAFLLLIAHVYPKKNAH
ncbi:MAG: Na+/H+ antiporter NhaC family protein, partial [Verrucomicrobiota bacterium]|nr:Na+/H+ antiporter NhaC family protein [Verrucomicrobiota bacterium]